jgi:hypothetical protein
MRVRFLLPAFFLLLGINATLFFGSKAEAMVIPDATCVCMYGGGGWEGVCAEAPGQMCDTGECGEKHCPG